MRKIFIQVFFLFNAINAMAQQSGRNEIAFICGPCGCTDDGKYFEKPGACVSCGMERYAAYKSDTASANRSAQLSHEEMSRRGLKVAILIFPGAEIIDFAAPWEIFAQAMMNVFTVAPQDTIINCMGMRILPDYTFENAPKADILLLPGGDVVHDDKQIMDWVKKTVMETETVLSVCNGAFFLGSGGFLDGKEATTFLALIPSLQQVAPKAKIVSDKRYVDNGKIITSAGLSSGIDASLHVIAKRLGMGRAQLIATNLEYNWDPGAKYVRGLLADKHLAGTRAVFSPYNTSTLRYEGNQQKWLIKISVETDMPADKLARLVEFQLEEAKQWKKGLITGNNSVWSFNADNKKWKGTVDFEKTTNHAEKVKIVNISVTQVQ
ncbi:MAG: DJ-1/PfpI family protein [Chitinophagaceae bacterium]|nr:DJ-1/PfpI family protein [Chitinophagaceae bacterium]